MWCGERVARVGGICLGDGPEERPQAFGQIIGTSCNDGGACECGLANLACQLDRKVGHLAHAHPRNDPEQLGGLPFKPAQTFVGQYEELGLLLRSQERTLIE